MPEVPTELRSRIRWRIAATVVVGTIAAFVAATRLTGSEIAWVLALGAVAGGVRLAVGGCGGSPVQGSGPNERYAGRVTRGVFGYVPGSLPTGLIGPWVADPRVLRRGAIAVVEEKGFLGLAKRLFPRAVFQFQIGEQNQREGFRALLAGEPATTGSPRAASPRCPVGGADGGYNTPVLARGAGTRSGFARPAWPRGLAPRRRVLK